MKLIFLILANDTHYYLMMQELWRKYMNTHKGISSYFIKYNLEKINGDKDIFISGDTIYIKGTNESYIPGCLDKTIKSIEYILENEDFDYVVRTNMSSVWDFNKIYDLVSSNNFITGGVIGNINNMQFISGAGILLNKDICKQLVENKNNFDYNVNDDVSIGALINNNNISITPFTRFEAYNYDYNLETINNELIENYYHFRCKSNINDNNTICIMKHIINLIYGV